MHNKDLTVLITGGNSGIGYSCVQHIQSNYPNFNIAVCDINTNNLKESNKLKIFQIDISNEQQIRNMINQIIDQFKNIHFVINSAGILISSTILKSQSKDLDKCLDINVKGTYYICKYTYEKMKNQNFIQDNFRGSIINVSSIAGSEGQIGQTIYSISKSAVNGLTLPLAREVGKYGISVNTIAPGIINTPMSQKIPEKVVDNIKNQTALNRIADSKELAKFIFDIMMNPYVTGEIIRFDGGIRNPKI